MKVRINSTISVPLDMKELYRVIQRAEQLTVSINLQVIAKKRKSQITLVTFQRNLQESSMGRDLLRAINGLCSDEKQLPVIDELRLNNTQY